MSKAWAASPQMTDPWRKKLSPGSAKQAKPSARQGRLRTKVLNHHNICLSTKLKVYRAVILTFLQYGYCTAACQTAGELSHVPHLFQTGFAEPPKISVDDHTIRSLLRTRRTTFRTSWLSTCVQVTQSIQRTFSDNMDL